MPATPTRLVSLDDAERLAALYTSNRAFLAPWEPRRPDSFFTVDGQRRAIADALARHAEGTGLPCVILDDGVVVGRCNLNQIVRGPLLSASLGYWVDEAAGGRGLASAAVAHLVGVAFDDLGLHRVEAGTLPHNSRSQAVLERNGFVRFGYAPRYLMIYGHWQDHVLYQRLAD